MKKNPPKKLPQKKYCSTPIEEENLENDDLFSADPDTLQRQAAHEACREVDLPDFLDKSDYD